MERRPLCLQLPQLGAAGDFLSAPACPSGAHGLFCVAPHTSLTAAPGLTDLPSSLKRRWQSLHPRVMVMTHGNMARKHSAQHWLVSFTQYP